jgi:hypothetical protein
MSDNDTIIDIDPTPERRPVLQPGKYGAEGEATLEKLRPGTVKYGKFAGQNCINMQVSVLTAEYGFIRLFRDLALEGQAKNSTLKILAQLGLDPTATRDPQTGRSRLDTSTVEGSKVIVELSRDEWDVKDADGNPTGERGEGNRIKNVWKRP